MKQRGVTLVEVLIALGIFAAVSAIGVSALSMASRGSEQLRDATERMADMERFRGLMRADLYQLVDRPVYEATADRPRPSFMGGRVLRGFLESREETALLALVRAGWANPGSEESRSELQAVTWLAKDGTLIRRQRPFLDAVAETPYRDDIVLEGLEKVEISFLSRGRWRDETGRPGDDASAVTLMISFVHPIYGEMEHRFLIGGSR
ncbi:MAG: type II secretion system minor pseudopilin GspJ [Parvularculaceae bacterium]|nr:type II secretion system minor pseudopilin GspJ [Parvularculaceae bacterium]